MKSKVLKLATKYKIDSLIFKINDIEKNINLKIGFLGEFSSGKSTLINALLDKKILPSMEKPTSKNIVEIAPKDNLENMEYFKYNQDNNLESISALNFSDIALGKEEGKTLIKVKSSEILKDGYLIVDTPGTSSLDKTDIDITYGYLQFLDGVIICHDVNRGSLTNSLVEFLKKKEIKNIANNLIFLITKTDTKDEEAISKIKNNIIGQLNDLGINNSENRVIALSPKSILEKNQNYSLDEFKNLFINMLISRREELEKERVNRDLIEITKEMIELLQYKLNNLQLNDSELNLKEKELKNSLDELKEAKKSNEKTLREFERNLRSELEFIANSYISKLDNSSLDDFNRFMDSLINEFNSKIEFMIKKYFKDLILNANLGNVFIEFERKINNIIKNSEILKTIATSILASILIPVGGAVASAGEIAGGAMVRGAIEGIKTGSKMLLLKKALKYLPTEMVIDYFAKKHILSKAKTDLIAIASKLSNETYLFVKNELEEDVFKSIEDNTKDKKLMIDNLLIDKDRLKKDFKIQKDEIENDITTLKALIIKGE